MDQAIMLRLYPELIDLTADERRAWLLNHYRCPVCGEDLEHKGNVGDTHRDNADSLYQCPACKNVEVI